MITIGRKRWVIRKRVAYLAALLRASFISCGSRGAFANAALYFFIETAKLCALEPYYYLRCGLSKLPLTEPDKIGSLLP